MTKKPRQTKKVTQRPIGDRVLVRRASVSSTTPGGIFLPGADKEIPTCGKVIAVGPGRLLDDGSRGPMEIAVGDQVVFPKYAGTDLGTDGGPETLLVLLQTDILIVEESAGN